MFAFQKKTMKMKKTSSFENADTDQESTSSGSRAPLHHKYDITIVQLICNFCREIMKVIAKYVYTIFFFMVRM